MHETIDQDREWTRRLLRDGDELAFRQLYRRHTPRLLGFVKRLLGATGSASDAEDVVQETWVRAVHRLDRFRWQSSLETWLCGIAQNLCRELFRRSRTREEKEAAAPPPPERTVSLTGSLRLDLEKAMALLPDGYRSILVLHDVEGWTHREIAQSLGISDGTSKSQLFEARRRVRTMLQGEHHATARARTARTATATT